MRRHTILLLGSGELGKEFAIAMARLGQTVVAVDRYDDAPAMQVTPFREIVDMLDGDALDRVVEKWRPDYIVPEIEAIRTERFYEYEAWGVTVIPSAKAANFTMDRRAIRDLAAKELGLRTAPYAYAGTYPEFCAAVERLGLPCVVKPLMSSSGKGQSVVKTPEEIPKAWEYAHSGGRGDGGDVIVEGFIEFDTEITLITVTQRDGPTRFCPPIGHRQERGDYQESWQPCPFPPEALTEAKRMAEAVTKALGGAGVWGVEFFLALDGGVVFSELSPRPHDTGMVTLAGTQMLSEFELHARAVLGLPIPEIELKQEGASAVVLADGESTKEPTFEGVEAAMEVPGVDVRLFGKPNSRPYRRMAVCVAAGPNAREQANEAAGRIRVVREE
ncbi:formate-dependent phosphoribosylglycinamide formyltransferase [soil metagenome]